jgi:hypothetical protein
MMLASMSNFWLITPDDHTSNKQNDLIMHIFNQLTSGPIKAFSEWMQGMYIDNRIKITKPYPNTPSLNC